MTAPKPSLSSEPPDHPDDHPEHVTALLKEAGPDAVYDPVDDYPARPYEKAKADYPKENP